MSHLIVIFLTVAISSATALEHFSQFNEGTCTDFSIKPVKANREFVDSLKYMSGGSKYHMYRTAFSSPNYLSMSQYEFSSEACYTRNSTTTVFDSVGAVFGFGGRVLNSFRVTTSPGVYLQTIPRNPLTNSVGTRAVVTLTDHKNFAVLATCWNGAALNDRAWAVVSRTPNIDSSARRLIENHAVSLGFKRRNFVFLSYDRCQRANPILSEGKRANRPGPLSRVRL